MTRAPDGHVALTAGLRLAHEGTTNLALGFGTTQAGALSTVPAPRPASPSISVAHLRGPVGPLRRRVAPPLAASGTLGGARVLRVGQRRQGLRGQDLPGRDRRRAGLPVGPGGAGRRPRRRQADVFRLLPRGVRPRPVRGVHRAARGRRRVDRPRGDAVLVYRQQQPDGSMPRNSLENGKPAPDTGGLQLDETSYPILMDWQSGLASDGALYRNHVDPGGRLPAGARAVGRRRALGGAVGLLALDDLGRDRGADRRRPHRHGQRGCAAGPAVPGDRRLLRAQHQGVEGDEHRPVHRRRRGSYFIRLSKTGDPNAAISYGLGNGSGTSISARSSTPGSWTSCASASCRPTTRWCSRR